VCHNWLAQVLLYDRRLYPLLLQFDRDLADAVHAAPCWRCGGRLDCADYPRKPRGGPKDLGEEYDKRLSFCCAREGCRRRTTPESVRFLGRKVYLGAMVVLVSAMLQGPTPPRAARLRELFGVSERTLRRWRAWWQTAFAESPFWKAARGRLRSPADGASLPLSLLEAFAPEVARERLVFALRFLAPITTASAPNGQAF
jgi:hypothetical protein